MQIQTNITETVERVQVVKEVKRQKATVTLEVNQDFLDVINVLGRMSPTEVQRLTGKSEMYEATEKMWNFVRNDSKLASFVNYKYPYGFTMKPQK